jgi:N-methylhydantoinase A
VCYGRGGTEPTITDANVVLGRLAPERFLGGEMRLDRAAAGATLRERIATPLGVDLERAASGMLEVAVAAMANTVRHVTLERGMDPRDFTLVAYGGAGPLHAAAVAKELAIRTVIIPQAPGHFSAFGMLMADLRRDFVQTLFRRLEDLDMGELEAQFQHLEAEARQALESSGTAADRIVFERAADMRYVGQEHSVTVGMPATIAGEAARQKIKQLFDEAHEQRYSHSAPAEAADVVSLRVSALGRLRKPKLPVIAPGGPTPPQEARRGSRYVIFDGFGALSCEVYDRATLLAGNLIAGPAVIEEPASVTVLGPDDTAEVNRFGQLVLEVRGT